MYSCDMDGAIAVGGLASKGQAVVPKTAGADVSGMSPHGRVHASGKQTGLWGFGQQSLTPTTAVIQPVRPQVACKLSSELEGHICMFLV